METTVTRITELENDGASRRYRVVVDAAQAARAAAERLRGLQRQLRMKGFRPGRAPLEAVRRLHGQAAEAAERERLAALIVEDFIRQNDLRPLGRPIIREVAGGGPCEFDCRFETLPDIALAPLEGLTLDRPMIADPTPATEALCHAYERRQVLDWLASLHDFAVPPTMLANEVARILRRHEEHLGAPADDAQREAYAAIAERRTRLALLLVEIGRRNGVEVPREQLAAAIFAEHPDDEERRRELMDFYAGHPTALAELHSGLFERSVVDHLMASARINERPTTAAGLADLVSQSVSPPLG